MSPADMWFNIGDTPEFDWCYISSCVRHFISSQDAWLDVVLINVHAMTALHILSPRSLNSIQPLQLRNVTQL